MVFITERMQALGDHARSSNQPRDSERPRARIDQSAAKQARMRGREFSQDRPPSVAASAPSIPESAPVERGFQEGTPVHKSPSVEDSASGLPALDSRVPDVHEMAPNASALDEGPRQTEAVDPSQPNTGAEANCAEVAATATVDEDAAKRKIIHEWENWSALHSDELGDPDVVVYFFDHLRKKKSGLLNFDSDDKCESVRNWLVSDRRVRSS
ncbi:MAG TPA: hypothetical protein VFP60_06310 [Pseudolabrys sp.]|nr:hypothetical protein [Pseudolabrys sp.]